MTLYKVLCEDGSAFHGGAGKWPLPRGSKPGKWLTVDGDIRPCWNGLHLCLPEQLVGWLGPAIFEAETQGELVDADDKVVAAKARLVRRCDGWNDRTARLFAVDCAQRALNREKRAGRTPDKRSYDALKVARRFADGKASSEELAAARDVAWDAAWAAERDVAWAAERDVAWAAAWDVAWAAAWAAERDAAFGMRAWSAAWAAARDAARAAERRWQTKRLLEYVEGKRA